jgi:hypothetical protein
MTQNFGAKNMLDFHSFGAWLFGRTVVSPILLVSHFINTSFHKNGSFIGAMLIQLFTFSVICFHQLVPLSDPHFINWSFHQTAIS